MASYEESLVMMSDPLTWPARVLFMKKLSGKPFGTVDEVYGGMKFGHMRDEGVTPCRIYGDNGEILEEFTNAFDALKAGWRVD